METIGKINLPVMEYAKNAMDGLTPVLPQKVYIVTHWPSHDGMEISGVFGDSDDAQKRVDTLYAQDDECYPKAETWKIK